MCKNMTEQNAHVNLAYFKLTSFQHKSENPYGVGSL